MKPILINLDLKIDNYSEVELKQGCGDTLVATVSDLGEACDLTGQVISLEMLKADKKFIIQTSNITVNKNIITIKLHKDFTRVGGKAKLQIKIIKDNDINASWVVNCNIRKSAIDQAIGESENIVTIKENLDNSITKAIIENAKTENLIENGGAATKGQVAEVASQLAENAKNSKIYNDRSIKYPDDANYGVDLANLVGQGLYPKNSPENNKFRAMVIHNYTDAEPLVIDNVGEMPSIFVRNARNSERRIDKPSNFIPKSNFLQFQQGYMDLSEDGTEKDTHSFITMFNMDYLGNMYWRNTRDDVQPIKLQSVSQSLANSNVYNFVISSYYSSRFLLDIQSSNNVSALKISKDTSGNTEMSTTLNGLKLKAYKKDVVIESTEGSIMLNALNGIYNRVGSVNLPLANFVANKPTSATDAGKKGDYFADSLNLYMCYNPNLWIKLDRVSF